MDKIVPPDQASIARAAEAIRDGKLVIVPTETVYGVAADATNAEAVKKIFAAKNRPADNPLIVHIADMDQVRTLCSEWNATAEALADRFWPGPLTLVVPKSPSVPMAVTGGLETVAVRMPEHAVALELIRAAGVPLAAPSANRFMELSPTSVGHIDRELADAVEVILDGGPCRVGVESTVVDLSESPIRILRPGGVSRADIEATLKSPIWSSPPASTRKSPGQYARHYAPRAPLFLVDLLEPGQAGLTFDEPEEGQIKMPLDPVAYAANLYSALHQLDQHDPEAIFVEMPPEDPDWETVHDRLRKAAG